MPALESKEGLYVFMDDMVGVRNWMFRYRLLPLISKRKCMDVIHCQCRPQVLKLQQITVCITLASKNFVLIDNVSEQILAQQFK